MIRKDLFAILVLALTNIACQPTDSSRNTPPSTQDDEAAIRQVFKQIEEKWNAVDLDGVMIHIADDFVNMPPGGPAILGKEAIRSKYDKFLSENTDIWKPSIETIEISGDLAILRDGGTDSWTPKDGGKTINYKGKALRIFRRSADGSWKMIIEIWNSNEPNATEAPL